MHKHHHQSIIILMLTALNRALQKQAMICKTHLYTNDIDGYQNIWIQEALKKKEKKNMKLGFGSSKI